MQIASFLLPMVLLQGGPKVDIKDIKIGSGESVRPGDFLTMDYTGKLTNNKVFDSSKKPGRDPFQFMIGAGMVIKGWDQGILGMKVGGERKLTIPASLGYGAAGAGADIPPNATLIFDVELKKIQRAKVEITKPGHGPGVKFGDQVSVNYLGKLQGGKKFDSSYDRHEPLALQVTGRGLIPGFTQGLLGMKVGEKRTVTIPPELGYAERGAGGVIPPNATLVFELELMKIGS